jgi:hypothetical protein
MGNDKRKELKCFKTQTCVHMKKQHTNLPWPMFPHKQHMHNCHDLHIIKIKTTNNLKMTSHGKHNDQKKKTQQNWPCIVQPCLNTVKVFQIIPMSSLDYYIKEKIDL